MIYVGAARVGLENHSSAAPTTHSSSTSMEELRALRDGVGQLTQVIAERDRRAPVDASAERASRSSGRWLFDTVDSMSFRLNKLETKYLIEATNNRQDDVTSKELPEEGKARKNEEAALEESAISTPETVKTQRGQRR